MVFWHFSGGVLWDSVSRIAELWIFFIFLDFCPSFSNPFPSATSYPCLMTQRVAFN